MKKGKVLGIAVIIENKKGEFLLHLRDENAPHMKNQWCLLGGHIDNDELPEFTAVREIEEEIGIKVKSSDLELFKKITLKDGISKSYIYYTSLDLDVDKIKISEGKGFKFFSKEEFLDLMQNLDYNNSFLKVLLEHISIKK